MSRRINFFIVFLFSILFSFSGLIAYAGPGNSGHGNGGGGHGNGHGNSHGHIHGDGHVSGHGKSVHAKSIENEARYTGNSARFSKTNKTAIRDYYAKNPIPVTELPPGIAMNLARGKSLPPGIAKRFLPPELLSTLPVRTGYEYLVAGNDVVLVNSTTGIIEDVIASVLK